MKDKKESIEQRKASGLTDYIALGLTTFGVGYIPGAPGTYGSAVAVAIYIGISRFESEAAMHAVSGGMNPLFPAAFHYALNGILLAAFCLIGIWASGRTAPIFGRKDPSQAVVDELMGQFITYCFIPFGLGWPFILAGFLLFRLFDIVKPFPIRDLEILPGGLGICADDIVAGVYAGLCLAVIYAVWLFA
ncbi:MAG: phosphatidylglycerophosphatase A [Acidobacteria bacterium]|nr:phosphatidylglycerophosphatase A [Acidobacteriota bacterium]